MEKIAVINEGKLYDDLYKAAKEVLTWDFCDIDEEPKLDIDKLQNAVDAIERLKTFKRSTRKV